MGWTDRQTDRQTDGRTECKWCCSLPAAKDSSRRSQGTLPWGGAAAGTPWGPLG